MITQTDINNWNKELIKLWNQNVGNQHLAPLYSPCFPDLRNSLEEESKKPDLLLIIGRNPSYSTKNWLGIFNNNSMQGYQNLQTLKNNIIAASTLNQKQQLIDAYFDFKNFNPGKIQGLNFLDGLCTGPGGVPYYQRIEELVNNTGLNWSHLDLYYYRETDQKKFDNRIKKCPDFFKEQLKITKEIIYNFNDISMILVANAKASDEFKKMYAGSIYYPLNPLLGTYIMNLKNKKVPVFFSSMLSGQGAIDKGSFERLKWHITALATIRCVFV